MRTTPGRGEPGDCLEPEALLAFLGDGPASERERVEEHVAECDACRRVLSALAELSPKGALSAAPSRDGESASPPPTKEISAPSVRAVDARATDTPAALATGERVGRYEVLGRVGEGGMGVVYAARDPELNRKIALKLLRPDLGLGNAQHEVEARLRREAQAMAKLAHPNVAAVYDVGHHEGRVFVAMEFVEGTTLARWLAQKKRPWRQALEPFLAACQGLAAAHAAGLVHRDVKPQNILVGDDGRVRVVDFGLARATDAGGAKADGAADEGGAKADGGGAVVPRASPHEGAEPEAPALTRAGALLGTPSYMAPEQLRGETADAKSDQFSFCVALYEALYGERPFAGRAFSELREAVLGGRVRPPPRGARVPGRLRRALLRGLSTAPGDRFATMGALLSELSRDPGRRWRQAGVVAAVTLGVGAGALLSERLAERRTLCQGAERQLAQAWGDDRRQAVTAALLRTGVPYAETAAREAVRVLDRYAAGWTAQRTEACEATRVRGEQTEEVMGLRMACLDDRRRELKALGDRLAEADRDVAQRAVEAAQHLSELASCADVRALTSPVHPPPDAATRAAVEALRGELAEARALMHAGKYRDGLAAARPLAERADRLRYRPLEAEVLALVGELALSADDYAEAEKSLEQAAWAAEAGRHDALRAQALTALVRLQGNVLQHTEVAEPLARRVTALLERLGSPPELEAPLQLELGMMHYERARFREASGAFERALALLEAKYGPDDLRLAMPLLDLGYNAARQEQHDRAFAYFERALAIRRRVLGDDHPEVAAALHAIAGGHYERNNLSEAEALFKRVLAINELALGPNHRETARALNHLGLVYGLQGRNGEAAAAFRRAVVINEQAMGPENPTTAVYLTALASAVVAEGGHAEGVALLERALRTLRQRYGDEHPQVAEALAVLGDAQMKLGRLREAQDTILQSHATFVRTLGPEYVMAGEVLRSLGDIHLRSRRPARAVEPLEGAIRSFQQSGVSPRFLALPKALLARARWESGGDRVRARALAREAHEIMQTDARLAAENADVVSWLRKNGLL